MRLIIVFLIVLATQNVLLSQIRHDICDKIVIGDFKCLNCISSHQGVAKLMRNAVAAHLNLDYTFCEVLNRDRLADILSRNDKEEIISSINELSNEEKTQLTTITKAQRVLFGEMEVQSDNSLLVTLIINNLGSGVQETTSIFEIPKGNYDTHSQREPHVNKGIERMLLGKTDGKKPPVVEGNTSGNNVDVPPAIKEKGFGNIIWMNNSSGKPSIWKIDLDGTKSSEKIHNSVSGWTLVNCFKNKVLWRHTSGKISLWTIDSDGNVSKYKEHGPIDGWTAVSYSDKKILWRHTSGKISLWSVDDDGKQVHYKEHGPIGGWTALFHAADNLVWKNTTGAVSIWKIDNYGNQTTYKDHRAIPDWTLVNCFSNKVLWRHTSGKVSLWTVDSYGNISKYKEYGPIGGWTAICYSDGKILWRHTSGKISLWTVDDDGNQTSYKEYGPFEDWIALFYTNKTDN